MQTVDDTLADTLARHNALVRREIEAVLNAQAPSDPSDPFYGIIRYHLGLAGADLKPAVAHTGKGLRGALLLLVAQAFGGDELATAPLAAAVELLHSFSLVHDDIEDGSPTRHHRATVWSLWGAPVGINTGDGLHALAHLALYRSPLREEDPRALLDVARAFDRATLRLAEGQHRDMALQDAPDIAHVSVDDYLRMIDGKTATLIGAAAAIGARAAGADARQAARAERFGHKLGLAFQMQDDILGIWGDERVTGKSTVSDITSRKKTLPLLLALAHGAPADRERLRALYTRPGDDSETRDTRDILALLDRAGARDLTRDYLRRYREAAVQALADTGLPEAATAPLHAFERRFTERAA